MLGEGVPHCVFQLGPLNFYSDALPTKLSGTGKQTGLTIYVHHNIDIFYSFYEDWFIWIYLLVGIVGRGGIETWKTHLASTAYSVQRNRGVSDRLRTEESRCGPFSWWQTGICDRRSVQEYYQDGHIYNLTF